MHILFVASRLPYPPLQGDRLRAYHQLRLLSQRHTITLVAPLANAAEAEQRVHLDPYCAHIEFLPPQRSAGLWRVLAGWPSGLPWQTLYWAHPRWAQRVQALAHTRAVDLVHVQLIRMAPVAAALGRYPRVLDLIDALSVNMARRAAREPAWRAWVWRAEAKRVLAYERRLLHDYSRLTVSSASDAAAIGASPHLHVVPNGVDLARFPFHLAPRDPARLVFTGRLSYFPNADAAEYLVRDILPRVQVQVPEVLVDLVGADPSPRVQALARQPGVTVTGYVPDLHSYLARATLAVAPLRAGSGMQLKVLEAMASGTPVVASPLALGGLPASPGEHLLLAPDANQFADKIVALLRDTETRQRLAHRARALVERQFTWEASVAQLEQVYAQARAPG
jgi:polysaccharide biosynthesis protein PslH